MHRRRPRHGSARRAAVVTEPTEAEVIGWLERLSNWKRWGSADQLGTLNLVGPQRRRAAAALVREGHVVSCGMPIDPDAEHAGPHRPQRLMIRTGEGLGDEHRVPPAYAELAGTGASAIEYIGMVFHGDGITHLDAPGHMFWDGKAYNDTPAALVSAEFGATELAVTAAGEGIVTRGVLLDAAALRGLDWLPPGTAVTRAELEAAEGRQGVQVRPGDAVLLRTGHAAMCRAAGPSAANAGPRSGWAADCLPWFHEREVALVGADTVNDLLPPRYPGIPLPLHYVGIVAMGLWLIDNCDLEALAAACERFGRHEFLFSVAPLRLAGSTGSPVNPLATF